MDKINEYLKRTRSTRTLQSGITIDVVRPWVECADGFRISIQASQYHYCSPRCDGEVEYESVELGFPNVVDPLIIDYADDPEDPTESVYGFVPVRIVCELVEKHGGIIN